MDIPKSILVPKGNDTFVQDDHGSEQDVPLPPSVKSADGQSAGVLVHSGQYMLYNFYGITFEVSSRYVPPITPIGRGAYGIVCSAVDSVTGQEVAIKKIGNAFADRTDAKRTLREIVILRHLKHPNVVTVKDVIRAPNPHKFKDVYIVYELMPTDLHEVIRSKQPMDDRHFKFILFQLLKGLKYIHAANVLHRDIKPSNILIDGKCNVKITDFGLARTSLGTEQHLTEYVVTRYYRAPELLLNSVEYNGAIDVWSVGCVFLELLSGSIALPGDNYVDQLKKIIELVGTPDESDLEWLQSVDAQRYIMSLPRQGRKNLQLVFPNLSLEAADLVGRMLLFDPRKRITVDDALRHPYLAPYNANIEEVFVAPIPFDLSFEQEQFTLETVRQLIYEQALEFNL